jgi:hypothetical protein
MLYNYSQDVVFRISVFTARSSASGYLIHYYFLLVEPGNRNTICAHVKCCLFNDASMRIIRA